MKEFIKHITQWLLIRVFGGLALMAAIVSIWASFAWSFTNLNLF